MKLSVIIPSYNREHILRRTLRSLAYQTLQSRYFEVIVVNDGGEDLSKKYSVEEWANDDFWIIDKYVSQENAGPAAARNRGAREAGNDILAFIGDDCIADANLLFRILYNHRRHNSPIAMQGLTEWHPDIAGDEFQFFLHESGLQANFNALKDENGGWYYQIPSAFCLTTNWSVHRDIWNSLGGMDEDFREAAYDDIEFGYRMAVAGVPAVFDSGAVTYHYHRYDFDSFAQRQKKEGRWRVEICKKQPERTGATMPSSQEILEAEGLVESEVIHRAKEMDNILGIEEQRWERWQRALNTFSLKGIAARCREDPVLLPFLYMPDEKSQRIVLSGAGAIDREDWGFALHCVSWLDDHLESAYTHLFANEVHDILGNKHMAQRRLMQSLEVQETEEAKEKL